MYARVSTRDQSADLQVRELDQFATHRGWKVVERYVDAGVSGATRSRPELDRLILAARRRRFAAVLVWKFDRFARSVHHLLDALELFRSLGIEFISYTEGIDTTTPAGKLVFTVLGAVAELERSLTQERVRAGMAASRAKGTHIGRPPALGVKGSLGSLRRAGYTIPAIAEALGVGRSTVKKYLRELRAEGGAA